VHRVLQLRAPMLLTVFVKRVVVMNNKLWSAISKYQRTR